MFLLKKKATAIFYTLPEKDVEKSSEINEKRPISWIKVKVARGTKVRNFVDAAIEKAGLEDVYSVGTQTVVEYASKRYGCFVDAKLKENVKHGRQYNIWLANKGSDNKVFNLFLWFIELKHKFRINLTINF